MNVEMDRYDKVLARLSKFTNHCARGLTDNQAILASYGYNPKAGRTQKGWLDRGSARFLEWARQDVPDVPEPDTPEFDEFIDNPFDEPFRVKVAVVCSHLTEAYKAWIYKRRVFDQDFDAARATKLLRNMRKRQVYERNERLARLEKLGAPSIILVNQRALVSKGERDAGLPITYPTELALWDIEKQASL